MNELKKKFEPVTYEGAGHGFRRAGEAPERDKNGANYQKDLEAWKANKKARDEAWERWKKLLATI